MTSKKTQKPRGKFELLLIIIGVLILLGFTILLVQGTIFLINTKQKLAHVDQCSNVYSNNDPAIITFNYNPGQIFVRNSWDYSKEINDTLPAGIIRTYILSSALSNKTLCIEFQSEDIQLASLEGKEVLKITPLYDYVNHILYSRVNCYKVDEGKYVLIITQWKGELSKENQQIFFDFI